MWGSVLELCMLVSTLAQAGEISCSPGTHQHTSTATVTTTPQVVTPSASIANSSPYAHASTYRLGKTKGRPSVRTCDSQSALSARSCGPKPVCTFKYPLGASRLPQMTLHC